MIQSQVQLVKGVFIIYQKQYRDKFEQCFWRAKKKYHFVHNNIRKLIFISLIMEENVYQHLLMFVHEKFRSTICLKVTNVWVLYDTQIRLISQVIGRIKISWILTRLGEIKSELIGLWWLKLLRKISYNGKGGKGWSIP